MITKEELKAQIDQLPEEAVQGVYQSLRSKLLIKGKSGNVTGSRMVSRKNRNSVIKRFIAWLISKFSKHQEKNLILRDFHGRFDHEDIRPKAYE
ncbi:MAG: hypothetical protein H6568_10090 [Lewinellaceae bacterium]|nr:hypothetical protein [Lewinellaceae bacterium]